MSTRESQAGFPELLRSIPLSLQHLMAMFGATVLVPFLTGLDPSTALLTGGLGTLIYILVTQAKIPAYLGSSFAVIGAITVASQNWGYGATMTGLFALGIVYVLIALLVGKIGTGWLNVIFPPVVVGSVVVVIGLGLARTALGMAGLLPADGQAPASFGSPDVLVALFTIFIVAVSSTAFRGFLQVIPILLGIIGGYIVALLFGMVDFTQVAEAEWFALPRFIHPEFSVNSLPAILLIAPIAIVLVTEHIGHLLVTNEVVGKDFTRDPGLHRSLLGDGLACVVASFLGGPTATTYGENIGVMAITKVYRVGIFAGAAVIAITLSFVQKLGALIGSIPTPVMGGVSIGLFGVIAAAGMRLFIERKVDFSDRKNLIVASIILVIGVGGAQASVGNFVFDSMTMATIVGILLHLILPGSNAVEHNRENEAAEQSARTTLQPGVEA